MIYRWLFYGLGLVRFVYWVKGIRIRRQKVRTQISQPSILSDCVIWTCDELCQGGGLCDRLNGIVSTYSVARQLGADFKLLFSAPTGLERYLLPNRVDWMIQDKQIDYQRAMVRHVPMMMGRLHVSYEEERIFHRYYMTHLFARKGVKVIYTNARLEVGESFASLFSDLFRVEESLKNSLEKHLQTIDGSFVGASFRFRNLLGDFFEPDSFPIPEENQQELISNCILQLEALKIKHPGHKIFVASDSSKFLSCLEDIDGIYFIHGSRSHLSNNGLDSLLGSFLDLFMLSESQFNYLFLTNGMYRSGFAETASFIGNRPFSVIHF